MFKKISAYCQYILPQHLITAFVGWVATSRIYWLKQSLITWFIYHYRVNMSEALIETPHAYQNFNEFFIRQLKPILRPIDNDMNSIASPVDGTVAQIGIAKNNQLLQAKNFYYDLETLLTDETLAKEFCDGHFATFYLAPFNYHRVHMPLTGTLEQSIYVPGKLFSVNHHTSECVPHLYTRNERLINIFSTDEGPMVIILVGALIVGGIRTTWMKQSTRHKQKFSEQPTSHISLAKGEELGYFKMGSTVILLFRKNKLIWNPSLKVQTAVKYGQNIGKFTS